MKFLILKYNYIFKLYVYWYIGIKSLSEVILKITISFIAF